MEHKKSYSFGTMSIHHSYDSAANFHSFERHCHNTYEILYVVRGKGKLRIEGNIFDISDGFAAFIPPCRFHCVEPETDSEYERYVIGFSLDDILPEVAYVIPKKSVDSITVTQPCAVSERIGALFSDFEHIDFNESEKRNAMARTILSQIVLIITADAKSFGVDGKESLGTRVIQFLNDKITSHITLDDIAGEFFISKSYLCRAFKDYNGISVLGYINGKRVAMARKLIEEGLTASDAAYSVGFSDYSTFFRAYKRIVGKSPTHKNTAKEKNIAMKINTNTEKSMDNVQNT
ncbi:MAG: AraC family transcriptional regulator [Eubacteriales bacterium]|nr:AraC family transcriptional regulator [Eubacteriales bacterium]